MCQLDEESDSRCVIEFVNFILNSIFDLVETDEERKAFKNLLDAMISRNRYISEIPVLFLEYFKYLMEFPNPQIKNENLFKIDANFLRSFVESMNYQGYIKGDDCEIFCEKISHLIEWTVKHFKTETVEKNLLQKNRYDKLFLRDLFFHLNCEHDDEFYLDKIPNEILKKKIGFKDGFGRRFFIFSYYVLASKD